MSNVLPMAARVQVACQLVEGVSIRGTERLTGVTKKTITAFGVQLGEGCQRLHDRMVRNVEPIELQMDEIWGYVFKKESRVQPADPAEWGDAYTWVGFDPHSKLVVAYLTGKRTLEYARRFVRDLKNRILTRAQITSDGLTAYVDAVSEAFGSAVDYGMVVKQYGRKQKDDHRYEPSRETEFIVKTTIIGNPDHSRLSTSMIERQNLTMRMHIRRLTRLTNAYSKKLRNLAAAVALHFAWYNFCRIHETTRVTPAMEAGIVDRVWSIGELVERALAEPTPPKPPPAPVTPIPTPGAYQEPVQLDLFGDALTTPPTSSAAPAPSPKVRAPFLRLLPGGKA